MYKLWNVHNFYIWYQIRNISSIYNNKRANAIGNYAVESYLVHLLSIQSVYNPTYLRFPIRLKLLFIISYTGITIWEIHYSFAILNNHTLPWADQYIFTPFSDIVCLKLTVKTISTTLFAILWRIRISCKTLAICPAWRCPPSWFGLIFQVQTYHNFFFHSSKQVSTTFNHKPVWHMHTNLTKV